MGIIRNLGKISKAYKRAHKAKKEQKRTTKNLAYARAKQTYKNVSGKKFSMSDYGSVKKLSGLYKTEKKKIEDQIKRQRKGIY